MDAVDPVLDPALLALDLLFDRVAALESHGHTLLARSAESLAALAALRCRLSVLTLGITDLLHTLPATHEGAAVAARLRAVLASIQAD